jgi:hypothetical protein
VTPVAGFAEEQWMCDRIRPFALTAMAVYTALALAYPVKADPSDKAGWSVSIDPRKRAFLCYVPANNEARVLTIGCLRDVDSFTIISSGLKIGARSGAGATLSLSSGTARYSVDGTAETDQTTGTQTFDINIDADATGLRKIVGQLLPILENTKPITLSVGAAELTLATSGLAQSLSRFKMICPGDH